MKLPIILRIGDHGIALEMYVVFSSNLCAGWHARPLDQILWGAAPLYHVAPRSQTKAIPGTSLVLVKAMILGVRKT